MADVGLAAIVIDTIIVTVTILGGVSDRTASQDGPRNGVADFDRFPASAERRAVISARRPQLRTKPYKTAVWLATVVIFGTLLMFLYPK